MKSTQAERTAHGQTAGTAERLQDSLPGADIKTSTNTEWTAVPEADIMNSTQANRTARPEAHSRASTQADNTA